MRLVSGRRLLAVLGACAIAGMGAGAGTYAALASGDVVSREVPVVRAGSAAATTTFSVSEIYRRTHQGVVEITVGSTGFGGSRTPQGQGSGFVYDEKGHVVTNAHVVDGATTISVRFWNGATRSATLVGSDPSTDLAVLSVDAPGSLLHPFALGDSRTLSVGEGVVAIGSPFGLEETVTAGIVSALHRQMTSPNNYAIDDSIQTDAAINHGNSGGPLLNAKAQVIGVNAQIESESGGNDGVGFAIPSRTVRSIASRLLAAGKVEHAYLGVAIDGTGGGARVAQVNAGTPAEEAGLQAGDVITGLDGTTIGSAAELRAAIDAQTPGETIRLTFTRDGKSSSVSVTLARRPS